MVFYEPGKTDHGLPRDPFKVSDRDPHHLGKTTLVLTTQLSKACVVPRPIGWISTRNPKTGVDNLAPYVEQSF
jgi:hypothetical protein